MEVAQTIELPNRVLAWREYGDPQGAVLLYLHGFPSSSIEARFFDAAARERQLRIIAPDRPGYGDSSLSPRLKVTDFPRDVEQLWQRLNVDRFGILAKGTGAPYALACGEAMAKHIWGIAIAGGVAPASSHAMATVSALAKLATLPFLGRTLRNPEKAEKAWISFHENSDPNELAASRNPQWRSARLEAMAHAFVEGSGGAAKDWAVAMSASWGFALGNVTVDPVILWHGDSDRKTPIAQIRRLADRLPHPDIRVLPDEGHNSVLVNHRDEILDAMATLART
ncbi:MAG: alpha/beta fold hydrolase [Propionibacteriaceae bacterium]